MDVRILVNNLDPKTTEEELNTLFAEYGEVLGVVLNEDSEGDTPSVSAIITMSDDEAAADAIDALEGHKVHKRAIRVDWFDDEGDDDEWEDEEFGEDDLDDDDFEIDDDDDFDFDDDDDDDWDDDDDEDTGGKWDDEDR
ncbi:MAG: hypothetical protein OHK0039_26220 [Bacteroidia bacterium]